MTIQHPNPDPRFPKLFAQLYPDAAQQLVLCDIGARNGFPEEWEPLKSFAAHIAFEPEAREVTRLQHQFFHQGYSGVHLYPCAIAGTSGTHVLFVTKYLESSGLCFGRKEWLDRFPFTTLDVDHVDEVFAYSLDDFLAQTPFGRLDFIKLDVEGIEHDVLVGGKNVMSGPTCLGVYTEIWWDPVIKGQPGFAEIDIFMRQNGFRFFDLELHRYPRSVLPAGRILHDDSRVGEKIFRQAVPQDFGQAFTGNALYFRDPVGELREGLLHPDWTPESLLRLCVMLDIYNYGDAAVEIVEVFGRTILKDLPLNDCLDALVPPTVDGKILSYGLYREASIELRHLINKRAYGLSDWIPLDTVYKK
ncbi:MAG: FkbM family methyltransferase [Alphaproteobacteria bacterium]|nr:MAG: FkbM family methyltransferase [Alphaproteobacteria bacterium]